MKKHISTLLSLLLVACTLGGALSAVAANVSTYYRNVDGTFANGAVVSPLQGTVSVGGNCTFEATAPEGTRAGEWWVYTASPLGATAMSSQKDRKVGEGASITYTMEAEDLKGQYIVLVLHLIKTYAVTADVSPTGAGTVTLSGTNVVGTVDAGEDVTLTANAKGGFAFDHWEGDATGDQNPVVISGVGEDVSCTAVFREMAIDKPTVTTSFTYDGKEKVCATAGDHYTVSGNAQTSAGTYTFKATLKDGYHWSDGSTSTYEVKWTIGKAENAFTEQPTIAGWTYGDSAKAPTATAKFSGTSGMTYMYYDSSKALLDGKPSDAGTYYLKATTPETTDYASVTSDFVKFVIAPKVINTDNISFEDKTETYDGTPKKIVVPYFPDNVTVTYEGNGRTEAGSQIVTANFSPKSANYTVSTNSKTATLTVEQATVSSFSLVASSVTYDGQPHQPVVQFVSTANGKTFTDAAIGWTVSYDRVDFVNAGEIKVTVTGNKNLTGAAYYTQTFTINRARTAELSATPTALTYSGQPQGPTVTLTHCAEDAASDHEKTEPGTYYVRATPDANHAWSDGSTSSRSIPWTISYLKVKVTFDLNYEGASAPSTSELNYMKDYTLPKPSRPGYDFKGWWTDKEGGTEVTTSTTVERSAAHTLYAHWEALTYNLTINLKDGASYEGFTTSYTLPTKLVYDATNLNELAVASKDGYNFQGYFLSNGTMLYDANGRNVKDVADCWSEAWPNGVYRHADDLTVEARFAVPYIVTTNVSPSAAGFVTGGGAYEKGKTVSLTATPNAGYSFARWETDGKVLTDNPLTFTVTTNVAYTAVFTGNVYTVTLENAYTSPAPTTNVTYGSAYGAFPPCSRPGYWLDGCWTSEDEETREKVTETNIVRIAGNHTLYANWEKSEANTVVWRDPQEDPNKKNNDIVDTTVTLGTKIDEPPEGTKAWPGKWQNEAWIAGWNPPLPQTVTNDLTFTAIVETIGTVLDCPELTFQRNDNWLVWTNECHNGKSCLRLEPIDGANTVTTSLSEPGRLTFWWWSAKGTKLLVGGVQFENRTGGWQKETYEVNREGDVRITCEFQQFEGSARLIDDFTWEPNSRLPRTVQLESDGHGTVVPATGSYDLGAQVELTATALPGYAFCCWTNDTGFTTNENPWTFTVTEDASYRATFTNAQYVVTLDPNGGTGGDAEVIVTYDRPLPSLTGLPTHADGWSFNGYTNATGVVYYGADGASARVWDLTEGATLAARWRTPEVISLTVTFDACGGTVSEASKSFTYGDDYGSLTEPEPPLESGLKFAGWYTSATGGMRIESTTSIILPGDHTLFAHWSKDVGELSKALDCENLDFEATGGWSVFTNEAFALKGISCLSNSVPGAELATTITTSGNLSFQWCGKSNETTVRMKVFTNTVEAAEMKLQGGESSNWANMEFDILASEGNPVIVTFKADEKENYYDGFIALDFFTWTPDTPEPVKPVTTNAVPTAVLGLAYDGNVKTGVVTGVNYTIAGNVATEAGAHTAVAVVTNGVWEGGYDGPTNIAWTIAKATYDMEGVVFTNETVTFDGRPHSLAVDEATLPAGVTVSYMGNRQSAIGVHTVTAMFAGDATNYEAIPDKTATLTILPPPEPIVTNAVPVAVQGLVYDGTEKVGVEEGANYTISGNVATNAGTYTAVATVTNGVWEGGSFEPTNVTWTIAKATYDMRGVTFASATYEFDGEEHAIAVAGVPSGVKVVYSGDATNRTEVGTNTVTASFKVLDAINYNEITTTLTAKLIITAKEEPPPVPPEPVLTNAVPTAVTGLVYDGTAKIGVEEGANYTIVGNVATNAGDYVATATVTNGVWEGGATGETNVTWTIAKAPAPDVSGVTFVDATFKYDGASHSIAVSGTVPAGVEVVYEGETNRTEVGTNTVTASFKVLDTNNYEAIAATLTAKLIITAKEEPPPVPPEPVVTNAVPTAVTGLVYNGGAQTGVAEGANYTIVGNVATNAGDYVATAMVTNGVWEGGATGETNVTWTIAKASAPDVSGVTFVDATYEYDGTSHTIAVSGTVPAGVEVVYSGDATNRTEVGTNTVTASFKVLDTNNYEAITTTLTAKLIIMAKEEPPVPPEPVVTNAVPTAATGLVYDGTAKIGVEEGANYTIVGNVATNAGDYVATATVTNGVWEGGATGETNVTWTIAKAPAPDVSGVTFVDATYEYDGTSHTIAVSGSVPAGVEVVYSGDATNRTEVGTNTVTACFKVLDMNNYEAIAATLTAKLIITAKEEPPVPPDPTVAYENIYFSATLAELGAEAVPTNRRITIRAEGLPKGLKLVTTALKDAKNKATGYYAYAVEGVPTETMDGESRIAYVRVTDNGVQTLYALDLSVLWKKAYEDKSFPDGEVKSEYANFSVTNLWPDVAAHPKNWTFSGWPSGIKFATKAVTARKKIDGVYVTQTNALAYEVYGTPTKAGRFTVKAVEKIAGTSYKSTHVATFTVWPEGSAGGGEEEWTDQAYVELPEERTAEGDVKSASGLPAGIKFTAKDIAAAKAHHFYGTPTKAGTYAVTLTHVNNSKTQFLWTITPAAAPAFELKLTETEVDPETAKATIRAGVEYGWAIGNTPGSKVTASGLPTGLKLSSTAVKEGSKTVGYTYAVAGVPTKAGEYLATFKTTLNGVTVLQTAAFTVLELPEWAQGTFNGGADETFPVGGQATFTVSKVGKLSGKWMSEGTNWTLSAASYDRYDDEAAAYVAQVVGKTGSGKKARSFTNELAVAEDAALVAVATNELFLAYRNNWKTDPWKKVSKGFAKGGEVVWRPYPDSGDDRTNDTVTLKFATSGKVTVKGKFAKSVSSKGKISWLSSSGSAVLCPQDAVTEDGPFGGVVFVYFPPKAKSPLESGLTVCLRIRWTDGKFSLTDDD